MPPKKNKEDENVFSDLFVRGKVSYEEDQSRIQAYADAGLAEVLSYKVVRDVDLVATGTRCYEDANKLVTGKKDDHNVKHINMAAHGLKAVPLDLTTAPPLVSLHLGYNLLTTINPRLFSMNFLAVLNLDQNDIKELPSTIGRCVSLRILTIKNNRMEWLPATFSKLTRLEELSLSCNKLQGFPICFGNLVKLRCLWMSSNLIEDLPTDRSVLLMDYDPITGTRKSMNSVGIAGLTCLQELWMENNRIQEVPPDLGRCQALRYCNLRRNMIESIPNEMNKLTTLEHLVLTHNQITQVDVALFEIPSLHTLMLDCNKITNLPAGLMDATSLTLLNISNNPLVAVPSELSLMTNLIHLYMSNSSKSVVSGQHLPAGWTRMHTLSSNFPHIDEDCVTIKPSTSRPGTSASRMYPDHDRSNPDVLRPATREARRLRPVEYWDGDIEGGSRPMTFMAPGGILPPKAAVKYRTPVLSTRAPAYPYSTCRPTTSAGRFAGVYMDKSDL